MDVYLIRHTALDIASGICYGQSDIELTVSFPEELQKTKSKLPEGYSSFSVYSSPLGRCSKLASELTTAKVITDPRLMELDFGDWERQKWNDIDDEKLSEWMADFVEVACPNGESYRALFDRTVAWWQNIISSKDGPVLVVTHGGVIRSLLSHILGIPLENSFRLAIDYGSISKVVRNQNRNSISYINR